MSASWSNADPRESIGKHADIVICGPRDAWRGRVETEEAWCIWTTHADLDRLAFIDADAEWPKHWRWTMAPELRL